MRRTRVDDMANRHCGKLSKGYRQRVGLAQAILHNPEVLILDEPTAGLDPKQIIETRQLIKELAGTHTIVLSTHILPEVSQTCDRVVIINKGRVVAIDTPANLTARLRGSETIYVQIDTMGHDAGPALQSVPGVVGVSVAETHNGTIAYRSQQRERTGYPARARPRGGGEQLGPPGASSFAHEPGRNLPQSHHRRKA